jgi:cytochrome c-type biogenesis protein
MIDPLAASMLAFTSRSPATLGLVFTAGLLTSMGPCIAPRYVAIAAIAGRDRRPLVPTLAFVGGLIGAFMALGFAGGVFGTLWSSSGTIDIVLAVALIAGGCHALVRAEPHRHAAAQCPPTAAQGPQRRSLGAIFLLGAASALVISPCCTPVIATVVATATAAGKPLLGAALLATFGAGHALPLMFTGQIGALATRCVPPNLRDQGPAIVSGVLMLALGIYYVVLA